MVEPWQLYAAAASAAIIIGIYGAASKRNMLKTILSVEIITASVNLNFLALGSRGGIVDSLAQSIVVVSIAIGACVAAVALSIMINVFRHYGSLDLKKLRRLRW